MVETSEQPLRVTLITGSSGLDQGLQQFLQHNGVHVVHDHALEELQPETIDTNSTDVLLVDVDDLLNIDLQRLDSLVGRSRIPVLFNAARGVPTGKAGNSLIAKLVHLARNPASIRRASVAQIPTSAPTPSVKPKLRVITPAASTHKQPAEGVWVLGASLGGPQAVTRFLGALPEQLSLSFVYVQHIGADFVPILARQLDQASPLQVVTANHGDLFSKHQMVLVTAGTQFSIDDSGVIKLSPVSRSADYDPSIDNVMTEVAQRYGEKSGAIIFSGMGDDGMRGVREITRCGGTVWAQDAKSCQISTMSDAARQQGVVKFSGTPEQLAARLAEEMESSASNYRL